MTFSITLLALSGPNTSTIIGSYTSGRWTDFFSNQKAWYNAPIRSGRRLGGRGDSGGSVVVVQAVKMRWIFSVVALKG